MEDLSFSWPLQNPQNSEMLLQPHCSEALAGEQEDGNGDKRHKVLRIAKVQGKIATPKQWRWESEIDFDGNKLSFSFFWSSLWKYTVGVYLSIQSLTVVYEESLFSCISLVPSSSFKIDLFLLCLLYAVRPIALLSFLPSMTGDQQAF